MPSSARARRASPASPRISAILAPHGSLSGAATFPSARVTASTTLPPTSRSPCSVDHLSFADGFSRPTDALGLPTRGRSRRKWLRRQFLFVAIPRARSAGPDDPCRRARRCEIAPDGSSDADYTRFLPRAPEPKSRARSRQTGVVPSAASTKDVGTPVDKADSPSDQRLGHISSSRGCRGAPSSLPRERVAMRRQPGLRPMPVTGLTHV